MKRNRRPTHPGEILKELYLKNLGITISEFAKHIHVSRKTISAIVNCRKSVTPEMSLRFSAAFPDTTPQSWTNLQRNFDIWKARNNLEEKISNITPLVAQAC
jgi:addiction module HigA family antidote